jgi:hypothetical protein
MLRSETDDLAAQLRIFEATPVDMEEVRIAPSFNHAVRAGEQRTRHGGSLQLQSTVGEGSSVNFLRLEIGNYGRGNKPGFPPR